MLSAGFETAIPAIEQLQTYALNRNNLLLHTDTYSLTMINYG
jgi:hypothetical protein